MKTKEVIIGSLLLYSMCIQAQGEDEVNWGCGTAVHGIVENIHFENCDEDIIITATDKIKETIVGGIIETSKRIIIRPIKGGKVKLVPSKGHKHTGEENHTHRGLAHRGTKVGTNDDDDRGGVPFPNTFIVKKSKVSIGVFPNPVKSDQLNIDTNEEIVGYKITDSFGFVHVEGEYLDNNKIKIQRLTKGMYNLRIQTKTQIITKTFYKN